MHRISVRLPLTCTLALGLLSAQDPISLPLPKAGSSMTFVMRSKMHQDIDAQGQQLTADQAMVQEYTIEITDAGDNGDRGIKLTYRRLQGSLDLPDPSMEAVEFDTGKPAADSEEGAAAAVRKLIDVPVTARIDTAGHVTKITGLEAAAKAARSEAGAAGRYLETLVGDNGIASLVRSAFGPLPKDPVAVGAKWDRDEVTGSTVAMQRISHCSLTKADASTAEIAIEGTVAVAKDDKSNQGATIKDGKFSGTATVDRADAFARTYSSKTTMTVEVNGGMVAVDITGENTLERAGPKAAAAEPPKDGGKSGH